MSAKYDTTIKRANLQGVREQVSDLLAGFPAIKYDGAWADGEPYTGPPQPSLVVHKGTLFLANKDHTASAANEPGC